MQLAFRVLGSSIFAVPNPASNYQLTLPILERFVGAVIFGSLSDRFGRRLPLIIDIMMFCSLEFCTAFTQNLDSFIVFRAFFGIAMGGEYGLGSSWAMEMLPLEARGIMSGVLQQGYVMGTLVATALYYAVVPTYGWRMLFLITPYLGIGAFYIRNSVRETSWHRFLQARRRAEGRGPITGMLYDVWQVLRIHWVRS